MDGIFLPFGVNIIARGSFHLFETKLIILKCRISYSSFTDRAERNDWSWKLLDLKKFRMDRFLVLAWKIISPWKTYNLRKEMIEEESREDRGKKKKKNPSTPLPFLSTTFNFSIAAILVHPPPLPPPPSFVQPAPESWQTLRRIFHHLPPYFPFNMRARHARNAIKLSRSGANTRSVGESIRRDERAEVVPCEIRHATGSWEALQHNRMKNGIRFELFI